MPLDQTMPATAGASITGRAGIRARPRPRRSVVLVAALALAACSPDAPPAQPADTKAMMLQHVQPEAQHYWNAVSYISDAQGSREIVPANDAEWERTAEAARRLRAWGEKLQTPAYAAGRGEDWADFSRGLVDAAAAAEAAALTKDPAKVLEAGGTLYNVCSACHEVYMPSPAGLAPTDQGTPAHWPTTGPAPTATR